MTYSHTLSSLGLGEKATVQEVQAQGGMRHRLLHFGFMENTPVECVGVGPMGDPSAYRIRGTIVALRSKDCQQILIK